MRVVLAAALAALTLSGCAVNWPTTSSGPRFSWSSDTNPSAPAPKPERALRAP
jgi:hypothetical protein